MESKECIICDCKKFESNIFDATYCKGCYHKVDKHVSIEEKKRIQEENKKKELETKKIELNRIEFPQKKLNPIKTIPKKSPQNDDRFSLQIKSPQKNIPKERTETTPPIPENEITTKPKKKIGITPKPNQDRIDISLDINKPLLDNTTTGRLVMSLDLSVETKKRDRRGMLILEIIETESEYVKSISYLLQNYLRKLQEFVEPTDINIIFSNIIWIYNINSEFQSELEEFKKNTQKIDQLFFILRKYVRI